MDIEDTPWRVYFAQGQVRLYTLAPLSRLRLRLYP